MRSRLAVAFAAPVFAAPAAAQPSGFTGQEPPVASAFGADPIIQITTTFRARIDGAADPREVSPPTAQDTARRTLYNMAANECTVLAEYWKAECRLNSFEVSPDIFAEPGVDRAAPSMFGTAVYQLKLRERAR